MMVSKALDIWNKKLKIPDKKGVFSIEKVGNSNLLLAKDYENRIGFILENTININSNITLKNFEISFFEELFNNKTKTYVGKESNPILNELNIIKKEINR